MNSFSSRNPRSHPAAARYLPAFAAAAVVGAVVIAGVAGGLGGGGGGTDAAETTAAPATAAPTTVAVTPAPTQVVVAPESTEVPTTHLSQPLGKGMAGNEVRQVQERLTELRFFPGPIDGQFGSLTEAAVWAFEKLVMQVPRDEVSGIVTDEMWQFMQQPIQIKPRRSFNEGQTTRNHTEVYLPEQVVAFFVDDEPVLISHASSGSGQTWRDVVTIDPGEPRNPNGTEPIEVGLIGDSITPGGVFTYDRFIEGRRESALGGMYNPAYFNYGIAIHGALNVPLTPESHGCIRVPMAVGEVFQQYLHKGDQVWVWDGQTEPEAVSERDRIPPFDRIDPDWAATTTTTSPTTSTTTPPVTQAPQTQPPQTQPPQTQPPATQPPPTTPPPTEAPTTTTTMVVETSTTVAAG